MLTGASFRKWLSTHINGHTAAVYQVNKYWQSAVSWRNSGMPSFTCGLQWKKMVEDTNFDLSLPHLESDENMTSKSSSTKRRKSCSLTTSLRTLLTLDPGKFYICSAVTSDTLQYLQVSLYFYTADPISYYGTVVYFIRSSSQIREITAYAAQAQRRSGDQAFYYISHCFYQSLSTSVKPKAH